MTLRQIEFFMAVYESGSFSKAAYKLFVSQQTISKSIRELETELKSTLFVRTSTGVEANAFGKAVYEELKDIHERLRSLPAFIQKMASAARETVRVVFAYGAIAALTKGVIDRFQSQHPEIQLSFSDEPDSVVEEKVLSGEADFGVSVGPIDAGSFEFHLLKCERMYLCINRSHPLYTENSITMDMLKHYAFLNVSPLFKGYSNLANCCKHAGFDVQVSFTSNEIITLIEMAKNNQGLLTLPESKMDLRSEGFRCVAFPDSYYNYSLYMIRPHGRRMSMGTRLLWDYLLNAHDTVGSY